ncbi:hypothetical protein C0J50_2304, partial [Silurus asotus]
AEKLIHEFMTSRLDYCNTLLGGCPTSLINKATVWAIYHHITPILSSLLYKLLLLTYKTLNGLSLLVPRIAKSTKGGRTFSHLAPKLWNSFPDTVWDSDTLFQFKCRLKTYLFSKFY